MTSLSQIIKNGQTLQAPAGALAINQNDLVVLGGSPAQLYSANVIDYAAVPAAGSTPVALTTYSSYGANNQGVRNQVAVNAADGSIFIADAYLTGIAGLAIWKYSLAGAVLANVIIDSTATTVTAPQIVQLSNQNFVVLWAVGNYVYFAIVDQYLNVVVPKTAVGATGVNPGPNPYLLGLSGGGFVVTYTVPGNPGGVYLAIFTNTGGVTCAPSAIPGVAAQSSANSLGAAAKTAQLSNGNIAVAILDTYLHTLSFAIYTVTGAVVVGSTSKTGATAGNVAAYPEISVLNGCFCISTGVNGNATTAAAYVLNNAGVQQGAPFTYAGGNLSSRLINDGVNFWFTYATTIVRIPATGTGFVSTAITSGGEIFYERGQIVVATGSAANVYGVSASGALTFLSTAALASVSQVVAGIGDFCAIGMNTGKFNVTKYSSASIIGLAQNAVAAGNAGTLVAVNEGPGGYICNALLGSSGKAYNHASTGITGNQGAMFNNSVTLKGI